MGSEAQRGVRQRGECVRVWLWGDARVWAADHRKMIASRVTALLYEWDLLPSSSIAAAVKGLPFRKSQQEVMMLLKLSTASERSVICQTYGAKHSCLNRQLWRARNVNWKILPGFHEVFLKQIGMMTL